jgi:hypothetical protein
MKHIVVALSPQAAAQVQMSVPATVILLTIAFLRIRSRRDRRTSEDVARAKADFRDRGPPVWFTGDQPQVLTVFPRPQASRPRIPPATSNPPRTSPPSRSPCSGVKTGTQSTAPVFCDAHPPFAEGNRRANGPGTPPERFKPASSRFPNERLAAWQASRPVPDYSRSLLNGKRGCNMALSSCAMTR